MAVPRRGGNAPGTRAARGPVASLRVYEPLAAFDDEARRHWQALAASRAAPGLAEGAARQHATALDAALRTPVVVAPPERGDDAFVLEVDGVTLVSPWSLRLRALTALEEWSAGLPDEVAEAYVPQALAEQASLDLEALRTAQPEASVHALDSSWAVPLRWFLCFEASEKLLLTDDDQRPTLVYRTSMARARRRVARAYAVVRRAMEDGPPVAEVGELGRWLEEFHPRSWVELDYGGLGDLIGAEGLDGEDSVTQVATALSALADDDGEAAGVAYRQVAERWQELAGSETAN